MSDIVQIINAIANLVHESVPLVAELGALVTAIVGLFKLLKKKSDQEDSNSER